MADLRNITDVIRMVLEVNEEARDSDDILYAEVCSKINPKFAYMSSYQIFYHRSLYGIPTYETVSRLRREVQRKIPKFKGTQTAEDRRCEHWKAIRKECGYDV